MTAPAITVEPATPVMDALGLMTRRRIRHLPVVEGGLMVGLISIGDVVKAHLAHLKMEKEALEGMIKGF